MSVVELGDPREQAEAEQRVLTGIFKALDSQISGPTGGRGELRKFDRQRFRTACTVRFLSQDGTRVETVAARSRNLSRGGIALLTKQWFRRGVPVFVTVAVAGQSGSSLAGTIVFSRAVRGAWFEVGIQFRPRTADDPLTPSGTTPLNPKVADSPAIRTPSNPRDAKLNSLSAARAAAGSSPDAQATILRLAASSDIVVRTRAVDALIELGGTVAADALIRALEDSSDEIRMSALASLGELGIPRTQEAIQRLLTDPAIPVRLKAAGMLGRLENDAGLPIVVRCLEEDGNEHAPRAAVAYGLIIGRSFAANTDGVAEARRYLDLQKKHK